MTPWWQTLVAALGGVVCLALVLSPMKAVLRARKARELGALNPLPFALLTMNGLGWVGYSYVVRDALVLWPNMAGHLLSLFYTLTCYGLAGAKTRDLLAAVLVCLSATLMVVGAVGTLGQLDHSTLKTMWGFTANAVLMMFYLSPLSTLLEVLRTRSSATLNLPLSAMNVINGTLWLVYGLALHDLFIAVPNGVGALLGVVYCTLLCLFPANRSKASPSTDPSEPETASSVAKTLQHLSSDDNCPAAGEAPAAAASAGAVVAEAV